MSLRLYLLLFLLGLPAPQLFAADSGKKLITTDDLKAVAEDAAPFLQAGRGDAKAWKRHRDAGRKAEKAQNYREAEQHYAAAVQEARGFGPRDKRLLESLQAWAPILLTNRKYRQSQRAWAEVIKMRETDLGSNHVGLIKPLTEMAEAAGYARRYDVAQEAATRAKSIAELHLGPYTSTVGRILALNGLIHTMAGEYDQAERVLQQAMTILQAPQRALDVSADGLLRPGMERHDHVAIATVLNNLALLYEEQKRLPETEAALQKMVRLYEREVGRKSEGVALGLYNLGRVYWKQEKLAEAAASFEESVKIREKLGGPNHPVLADSWMNLSQIYLAQGKRTEAEKALARAKAIRTGR